LSTKSGREEFIALLHPGIYVVSQNSPFQAEKRRILKKNHGCLRIILPHNPAVSTTQIISDQKLIGGTPTNHSSTGVNLRKKE
jgi:hypothetical protein